MFRKLLTSGIAFAAIFTLFSCKGNQDKTIPVVSVTVSPATLTLTEGDTAPLTAVVSPSDATDYTLSWASANPDIAAVSPTGVVTAIKAGNASVIVSAGTKTGTCFITVNAKVIPVGKVEINPTTLVLDEEQTATLTATVMPSNATNPTVSWTSSDPTVASVDGQGKVTAIKSGTTTITATADGQTAQCTVTVNPKKIMVEGVTLEPTELELELGMYTLLTVKVIPESAADKSVTWSSSDSSILTVNEEGLIHAINEGTATIVVTTNNGNKTASCTISVTDSDRFLYYQTTDKSILQPKDASLIGEIISNTYEGDYGKIACKEKITIIGEDAFMGEDKLFGISPSASVTILGRNAFKDCSHLGILGDMLSVTTIGDYAFENCTSLRTVTLPSTLLSIGIGTFSGCSQLSRFEGDLSIISKDKRYLESNGALIAFAPAGLTTYSIPTSVTAIGVGAMKNCLQLNTLYLPYTLSTIETAAFEGCSSLATIYLNSEVPPTLSDHHAFDGLPSDYKIYVPYGKLEVYQTAQEWIEIKEHIVEDDASTKSQAAQRQ